MSANREVPIEITSRHGHVSGRMEEYATKKAVRLLKFHDRISRIEIVVDGPHEAPEVEMIVHVEHSGTFVSKQQEEHFSNAVDSLVAKLERQLVKAKEKQRDHGKGSIRNMDVDEQPPEPEETYDDVVRRDLNR